jgi:DNA adenine methylase
VIILEELNKANLKPVVKWAGGKGQLISTIADYLPLELKENKIEKYIEPFVGGGAVLFYLLQNYDFKKIVINDLNRDLINLYKIIRDDVEKLIKELNKISDVYLDLNEENKKKYYYDIRREFNQGELDFVVKGAYFIFLNKTCFNGLYRVNSKGDFNVPHGKYKNPKILDRENLLNLSKALQQITILNKDFEEIEEEVDEKTFVYFDPPYRPLNSTSSFTSYNSNDFNDSEQIRLANFFKKLDSKGAKLMLSNSDPKNTDLNDNFFDELYKGYKILRVKANRNINSDKGGRGKINELLILNY